MRHLQARTLEPALYIEPLVRLRAIQNTFITSNLLGNEIERLNDLKPEFLALLVFRDGNVFDVAYDAKIMDTTP